MKEGMKEGINKGKKEERRNIINSMLKKGINIKEIQEITKATKKEIEGVKGLLS